MKQIFQSHWKLYRRYLAMANVLRLKNNKTDEEKAALRQLDEQADEHYRAYRVLNHDRFLMVV